MKGGNLQKRLLHGPWAEQNQMEVYTKCRQTVKGGQQEYGSKDPEKGQHPRKVLKETIFKKCPYTCHGQNKTD
jgi:hypothetical protein